MREGLNYDGELAVGQEYVAWRHASARLGGALIVNAFSKALIA